jgi:hypothetical protein
MSRKHFQLFADAVKEIDDMIQREAVAFLIANVCKQANSNFDYDKFYKACGIRG